MELHNDLEKHAKDYASGREWTNLLCRLAGLPGGIAYGSRFFNTIEENTMTLLLMINSIFIINQTVPSVCAKLYLIRVNWVKWKIN
jgi:hypothetical protein